MQLLLNCSQRSEYTFLSFQFIQPSYKLVFCTHIFTFFFFSQQMQLNDFSNFLLLSPRRWVKHYKQHIYIFLLLNECICQFALNFTWKFSLLVSESPTAECSCDLMWLPVAEPCGERRCRQLNLLVNILSQTRVLSHSQNELAYTKADAVECAGKRQFSQKPVLVRIESVTKVSCEISDSAHRCEPESYST